MKYTGLVRIISGGQFGADVGGLKAAKILRLQTGGTVPKDCLTEDGPNPKLVTKYGCKEYPAPGYPGRTIDNVYDSDGTIVFAKYWNSPGTVCTVIACSAKNKPLFKFHLCPGLDDVPPTIKGFLKWLEDNNIKTLNVAGHRESKYPGIEKFVTLWLVKALKKRSKRGK